MEDFPNGRNRRAAVMSSGVTAGLASLWAERSRPPALANRSVVTKTVSALFVVGGIGCAAILLLSGHGRQNVFAVSAFLVVVSVFAVILARHGASMPLAAIQLIVSLAANLLLVPAIVLAGGGVTSLAVSNFFLIAIVAVFILFTWRTALANLLSFQVLTAVALTVQHMPPAVIVGQCTVEMMMGIGCGFLARAPSVADHDALTGLPNRRGLQRVLSSALSVAEQLGGPLSVAIFDLDGFKIVNDTRGHAVGDRLLQDIGTAWTKRLSEGHTLARLGGDEFALVMPGVLAQDAVLLVDELRDGAMSEGRMETSAGVAPWRVGDSASLLLGRADAALYKAKNNGRNQTVESGCEGRQSTELLRALAAGEFAVFYQPVVRLATGRVGGAEALIRWIHPERGLIPPVDFIPVAERTGAICEIGAWVLLQACHDVADRIRSTGEPFRVSVNASGIELMQPGYVEMVSHVLKISGLPAAALVVEVTESTLDGDQDEVIVVLQALRTLGIGVAIDDFGTGYSTLSRLDRLPASILKIDQSFVRSIDDAQTNRPILAAIVSLARGLGMEALAEGVETKLQADLLRGLGVASAQGYFYGRPAPMQPAAATPVANSEEWPEAI